jgi:outer membrane protein, multidrug efflux system
MREKTLLLGLSFLLLGGCSMAPKYNRPDVPVPKAWPESTAVEAGSAAAPGAADLAWREFFTDTSLRFVIELALVHNRDLRIAALNVEKARALYRIQRSNLLPSVAAAAGADDYRVPEQMTSDGDSYTVAQYSVLGTISWELDLFGRVRSLKAKALNQFFATAQARTAVKISLVAAVAENYLTLAADQEALRLAQATLEAQKTSYDLIQKSRDAGVSSDLVLRQSQSQVEAARVDVARYTGLVAVDKNALNLLVGTAVSADLLPDGLGTVGELKDVSAGLDSEVLLRRPDILAAEFLLKGANANIGAARAAFFPRISLTAAAGTVGPELSSLFESGTGSWSFVPQIVAPIFAGGSLTASLKAAKVDRSIAVAQYEKTIQSAFREVSDALVRRITFASQLDAQMALVSALDESYRLSDARYKAGIDSYLGVLVTQRSLYDAQRGLVAIRLARQANQVALFKVLGGGI